MRKIGHTNFIKYIFAKNLNTMVKENADRRSISMNTTILFLLALVPFLWLIVSLGILKWPGYKACPIALGLISYFCGPLFGF